jgi:hypothetical protein
MYLSNLLFVRQKLLGLKNIKPQRQGYVTGVVTNRAKQGMLMSGGTVYTADRLTQNGGGAVRWVLAC